MLKVAAVAWRSSIATLTHPYQDKTENMDKGKIKIYSKLYPPILVCQLHFIQKIKFMFIITIILLQNTKHINYKTILV